MICSFVHTRHTATGRLPRAFTLIEILIVVVILGILASVVLPQFSNASQQARENSLRDDLRYLKTQIAVFKAQHRNTAPGYPPGNTSSLPSDDSMFIAQLTKYSNESCDTSDTASSEYRFGPYLNKIPANPVNGKSAVKITTSMTFDSGDFGWLYDPTTEQIQANLTGNDSNGVAYSDY